MNMVDVLLYLQENRAMKPLEIVLSRGSGMRKSGGGGETKVYYKHM
jgi:hypothetical protein